MNNPLFFCTDLDGPILDCKDRYYAVYKDTVNSLGGTPIPIDDYWHKKRTKLAEKEILLLSDLGQELYDKYTESKIAKIEESFYLEKDFLQPEVKNTLKKLKDYFQHIVLITLRRNENALMEQLKSLDIYNCFDYILTGHDEQTPPWLVKRNLFIDNVLRNNSTSAEGFFIGDTEVDIIAGKKIGFKTIAVSSGIRTSEILLSYEPNLIVDDLKSFVSTLFLENRSNEDRLC